MADQPRCGGPRQQPDSNRYGGELSGVPQPVCSHRARSSDPTPIEPGAQRRELTSDPTARMSPAPTQDRHPLLSLCPRSPGDRMHVPIVREASMSDKKPAIKGSAAVLDEAHLGDIKGAFGTIRQHDLDNRRTWGARLPTLLAIMGPGLIVMVGDNDAGGVATYAQAGQNYGLTLLWTLPLLIPVLVVNQEMVVRLGAVTGVGHARLIFERFGRFWGAFSVGDLFILNFLTIVTEFIGVSLALGYFGISPYISVPFAAGGLGAITLSGSVRCRER